MTDRQKKICAKYGKRDADGFVHCAECPLVVDGYAHLCKMNSVYNRRSAAERDCLEYLIDKLEDASDEG